MDIKKAVAAISTILIILLSFRFAAAQITIPTPTGEFDLSTTFGMAVAAFIIGFGMMGIFIAWLYRQKKLRPEVVFPFEPKTLSGKSGILIFEDNTSLTLAIPAKIIREIYQKIDEVEEFKNTDISKFDTIESLIAKKDVIVHPPKTPAMRPVSPEELLKDYYKK